MDVDPPALEGICRSESEVTQKNFSLTANLLMNRGIRVLGLGIGLALLSLIFFGCVSQLLKEHQPSEIQSIQEFEQVVKVQEIPPPPTAPQEMAPAPPLEAPAAPAPLPAPEIPSKPAKAKKQKEIKKKPESPKPEKVPEPTKKEPPLEDSENFIGRRPAKDPFRVGEKVVLALSYFGAEAGEMTIETRPFVFVNDRQSYTFVITVKSSSMFSLFYSVDDWAETFVDYQTLLPTTFALHVKESGQIKEARTYFNREKNRVQFWENKITKDQGTQSRKLEWDMETFSQNAFSAAFYMRTFTLRPGKSISFQVTNEGKNLIFKGKILRQETLKTEIGPIDTLVLEPQMEIEGAFAPVGQILLWLTNDDRKHIVRIESKIKIGTIVGTLRSLTR